MSENATATTVTEPSRLKATLEKEIWPKVQEKFGIRNPMALPRLDKIVVNIGVGKFLENNKLKPEYRDTVLNSLTTISGQKPILITAKRSVANFKVREGATSAAKVTMRRDRMWQFLDRLIHLAIPRVKDFRGLPETSFDQHGSYSFGFTEQAVWPEIDMTKTNTTHGMHVNLVFCNSTPEISRFVLQELGFPLKRPEEN